MFSFEIDENTTATELAEALSAYDSKADEVVEAARAFLLAAVGAGRSTDDLMNKLEAVARAEGFKEAVYTAYRAVNHRAQNGAGLLSAVAYANQALAEALGRGAGDDYSGRGNDAKRAHHDGYRKAVEDLWLANSLTALLAASEREA